MPRDWEDLLIAGERVAGEPAMAEPAERGGVLSRLRESMRKTRAALGAEVRATLFDTLDEQAWERLEEALIAADVGARVTAEVVGRLEQEATAGEVSGGEALTERLIELLAERAAAGEGRIDVSRRPAVILVVGVNGTGKTTTIGKLAHRLRAELGGGVVIGAADTFRAAATEQLERWAQRAGAELVRGEEGGDPAAVAYDALARARSQQAAAVIVDTAGRLHTRGDLMAELGKIGRVLGKTRDGAPDETLLVIDATTGQNGLAQARLFADAVPVTGAALTKLDGTARGGIALAIAGELGIAVKLIGVGEGIEDLRPFDAREFARALIA